MNALEEIETMVKNIIAARIDYTSTDVQCGDIKTQAQYDYTKKNMQEAKDAGEDISWYKNALESKIVSDEEFNKQHKQFTLYLDHTDEELKAFKAFMDFKYNEGYGTMELDGTLWLKDGTWMTRGEYNGSEWWNYHSLPEMPERKENP